MDILQKAILSGKQDSLTSSDIQGILSNNISAEFIYLWKEALMNGILKPDIALVQAISKAKVREYLILIALSIRYGANTNMYILTPRIGSLHILGYVYASIYGSLDNELANLVIIMLLLSNSKISMPAFDASGGKIEEMPMLFSKKETSTISINDWLKEQNIKIMDIDTISNEIKLQMGIFLDRMDLITSPINNEYLITVIRAFSTNILEKAIIPKKNQWIFNGIDYEVMEKSLQYINPEAILFFLDQGASASYLLINEIILQINRHRKASLTSIVNADEKILLEMISRGVTLDKEQFSMLGMGDGNLATKILEQYDQPYWKKICKVHNNTPVPDRLKQLAFALNIDSSLEKNAVCEALQEISAAEPDKLLAAAVKRQQQRISSNLSLVSEYIDSNPPYFVCRNRTLLQHDPFEYGDVELATYRDEQEVVWCFTSEMFENLIHSGINPYNMQKLPEAFIQQLKAQLDILKKLGIDYMNPINFQEAINKLTAKDDINNIETEKNINSILALAALNGIDEKQLKNKSADQLERALASVGIYANLKALSGSHILATFAYVANTIIRKRPEVAKALFINIK